MNDALSRLFVANPVYEEATRAFPSGDLGRFHHLVEP